MEPFSQTKLSLVFRESEVMNGGWFLVGDFLYRWRKRTRGRGEVGLIDYYY